MSFKDSVLAAMSGVHCSVFFDKKKAEEFLDSTSDYHYVGFLKKSMRNLSMPEVSHLIDGTLWLHRHVPSRWASFTPRAIVALGRLTPDLRWAAAWRPVADGLYQIDDIDLDWRAVEMAEKARETDDARTYLALADINIAARAIFGKGCRPEMIVKHITPQFPKLRYDRARRIFMGQSPASLSCGILTRREAHQWCLDGAPDDILRWLSRHLGVPYHRSAKVIRWLAHCRQSGRWPSLERQREMRIEGRNEPRICSLLEILDEVQEEDILTGLDSVCVVMQRIAARLSEAWRRKYAEDHAQLAPAPHWASKLPRGVRLLNTAADLIFEGQNMRHCVGSYVEAVRRGKCYILSITTPAGRSTAELSPSLEIVQHRGVKNSDPPRENAELLRRAIKLIKRRLK